MDGGVGMSHHSRFPWGSSPLLLTWVLSSVGRASALHAECRQFEPGRTHHSEVHYWIFAVELVTPLLTSESGKIYVCKVHSRHTSADYSSDSALHYGNAVIAQSIEQSLDKR